jgi:hypothetical protein
MSHQKSADRDVGAPTNPKVGVIKRAPTRMSVPRRATPQPATVRRPARRRPESAAADA